MINELIFLVLSPPLHSQYMDNIVGIILAATVLALTILLCRLSRSDKNGGAPVNWPVLGMLPSLLWNLCNFYEWATPIVNRNGGTIKFSSGFFPTSTQIITSNPLNLEYILVKSQSQPCFVKDEASLEHQKQVIASILSRSRFDINLMQNLGQQKILSALDEACKRDSTLDLQDLLLRFGLDYACLVVLGNEEMGSLVSEFSKAYEEAMETWAYSFMISTKYYSQKYMTALKLSQQSASKIMVECREKQDMGIKDQRQDLISPGFTGSLQDLLISTVVGCRVICASAMCWFFWLVSKHPEVEDKIMLELSELLQNENGDDTSDKTDFFDLGKLNGMQYLEAALCETLRLYPSFPLGHMRAMEDMVLPDGTSVQKGCGILYLIYGANRMESVWGKDASEFKPERWIQHGVCVKELDFCKYPVFGAEPLGACLDMAKCLATNILVRYHVTVEEEFPVEAKLGMSMPMKYGLKVSLNSREDELQAA